jgi:hypothetical protein
MAAVHRGMDASIDDGLAIEAAAFVEKRQPTFLGR